MKTYSDLQDIDTDLRLTIVTKSIGNPEYSIKVNNVIVDNIKDNAVMKVEVTNEIDDF